MSITKRVGDIELELFNDSDTVIIRKHYNNSVSSEIRLNDFGEVGDVQYALSCAVSIVNRLAGRRSPEGT